MGKDSVIAIEALAQVLRPGGRLLGLDVGSKTVGLALSDMTRAVATPLTTIKRTKFTKDAAKLSEIIENHEIFALVIGLPLNMDGSEGPRAQSVRAFARNLSSHVSLPVAFWDERLSTAAAERTLLEADASRKRRGEVIDKMAAAIILQGALDRLKGLA